MTYHTQFLKTIMMLVILCLPIGLGVNMSYFISAAVKNVHSVYSDARKIDLWDILAVGAFVILEEFVFRSAIINALSELELSAALIVGIAIIVFALNHVHWGLFVFIQKLFSGCVFVLLYVIYVALSMG